LLTVESQQQPDMHLAGLAAITLHDVAGSVSVVARRAAGCLGNAGRHWRSPHTYGTSLRELAIVPLYNLPSGFAAFIRFYKPDGESLLSFLHLPKHLRQPHTARNHRGKLPAPVHQKKGQQNQLTDIDVGQ
jgi:hypothetical protein